MSQLRIVSLNRKCIPFAIWEMILSSVIPQTSISIIGITEIERGFRRKINQVLKSLSGTTPNDLKAQETASFPVYKGQDIDSVFLLSMKEKTSSNSAIWTSFGVGGFESCSAYFRTQLAIVWWLTPRWRAILLRFIPSTYISMAWRCISIGYPLGFGLGVYFRLQNMQQYRCLPETVLPTLFCLSLRSQCGHFMPLLNH